MILSYYVKDSDEGRTVHSILRFSLHASASLVRRLKRTDGIRVDSQPVFTDYKVTAGQTVTADVSLAEPECDIVPQAGELDILYEDEGLLAVNKPAGIIVHPSHSRYVGTLSNYVAGYLDAQCGDGRCHAVNRLDRDTSGIVLFAKNSHMKALASQAMQSGDAVKEYSALVFGTPEKMRGTIDRPIIRLREGDMMRGVSPDGQRAVTHYTVQTADKGGVSLLHLTLETGRTHQIRVHCHSMGWPVLGDTLYYTPQSRELSERLGIKTQALHARRLRLTLPASGVALDIAAPEPEIFVEYCHPPQSLL